MTAPLLEAEGIWKTFGSVIALQDISMTVQAGQVTCVLGDNGAGKSTLIKVLSGFHTPDRGRYLMEGTPLHLGSPRDARDLGIATVYQHLALVPLMPIWRNFFLGSEPTKGWGPLRRIDVDTATRITREQLAAMGIDIRDAEQAVGTMSGGERQSVAIARAVYFGARVLILDEPTSALGVKQAGVVLRYIVQARDQGLGVIFITHNPHHAYPVGDRFLLLNRGRSMGMYEKSDVTRDALTQMMAGGAEIEALSHELQRDGATSGDPTLSAVAEEFKSGSATDE